MERRLRFLDLFAGGGGLSEGFVQAGFEPVAHVERGRAQCYTLRTRRAYHWLKQHNQLETYADYLKGNISRSALYGSVPERIMASIINAEIGEETLSRICRDIDELLQGTSLDLIIGGPPCQAYSIVGRSRDQLRMKGDARNYMYRYYASFLKRYQPTFFVFENVTGLLSAKDSDGTLHLHAMQALFSRCGYETEFRTLSASSYGVLQNRRRVFLVGRRGKRAGFYPEPEMWQNDFKVREVFSGLPELKAGTGSPGPTSLRPCKSEWLRKADIRDESMPVTWHQARPHSFQDLKIYRRTVELWNTERRRLKYDDLPDELKTHRNRTAFIDRFKVVAADLAYSQTVVAHIAKDGHYYIHPDIYQNRSLTPREAARLQTFPDNYYFESIRGIPARTPTFSQIGEAVPVLLARRIAEKLRDEWS